MELNLEDSYVGVESRDTLERRDLHVWQQTSGLFSGSYYTLNFVSSQGGPGGALHTESPERKRASIPNPERMVRAAPAFGSSPSEKQTLNLIADHPMIPREHLARWLGVSEGRASQMMRTLVDTWGLVERRGKRGDIRDTLSAEGIRYITHRDRAQLPTTQGIWSTALTTARQGRSRHLGHRIETWARQTKHADGITWFLSKPHGFSQSLRRRPGPTPTANYMVSLKASTSRRRPGPTPTANCCGPSPRPGPGCQVRPGLQLGRFRHRPRRRGADDRRGPSCAVLLRVRASRPSPRGSHRPPETIHEILLVHRAGRRPAPVPHHVLFVVDSEDVEATYVRTAARMTRMSLPILVSCRPVLSNTGILGRSWRLQQPVLLQLGGSRATEAVHQPVEVPGTHVRPLPRAGVLVVGRFCFFLQVAPHKALWDHTAKLWVLLAHGPKEQPHRLTEQAEAGSRCSTTGLVPGASCHRRLHELGSCIAGPPLPRMFGCVL